MCNTNGDCCSNQCAPDRKDPSKHTCTDEEPSLKTRKNHVQDKKKSFKTMAADTGDETADTGDETADLEGLESEVNKLKEEAKKIKKPVLKKRMAGILTVIAAILAGLTVG